jgi:glycosyltransferase involved in cell wall biosynthesis
LSAALTERRAAPAPAPRPAALREARAPARGPELGVVGAFPFPAPRGSQRFLLEQARALREAGAGVRVVCYGSGDGRALHDVELRRAPRALSPGLGRSPVFPGKAAADVALGAALVRAHRERPFDALLAHNAEAAAVALLVRRALRVPVVYVAHTLWRVELESYLPATAPPVLAAAARRAGAALDAGCARAADAVIALSRAAERALAAPARGPLARLAPGLAPAPEPTPRAVAEARARHGLARPYAVYAGNLDRYQDLALLDAAARRSGVPCVAVTHDARAPRFAALRVVRAAGPEEARALAFGAELAVLPRRHAGGFPIKLLGYLEAGLPVVAFAPLADTLVHGTSGWLLGEGDGADALAGALAALSRDAALRARLAAGGRDVLAAEHAWPVLAARTLALVEAAQPRR